MSAAEALKAAREAGIELELEGDDLVWEAAKEPAVAILDLLSRHKPGIVRLLRPAIDGWSAEDWQAFFDERAGIVEHDGGFRPSGCGDVCASRTASIIGWRCIRRSQTSKDTASAVALLSLIEQASVVVTWSDGTMGRLHAGCAPTWKNLRRWDARTALMWLLDSTKRVAP